RSDAAPPVCVVANPRPVSGWPPYGGVGALPKIGQRAIKMILALLRLQRQLVRALWPLVSRTSPLWLLVDLRGTTGAHRQKGTQSAKSAPSTCVRIRRAASISCECEIAHTSLVISPSKVQGGLWCQEGRTWRTIALHLGSRGSLRWRSSS